MARAPKTKGKKLAPGECKIVRQRNGCQIKFCRTGRGPTGYQFMRGTRRCPAKPRR